jgi:hypothetical protein
VATDVGEPRGGTEDDAEAVSSSSEASRTNEARAGRRTNVVPPSADSRTGRAAYWEDEEEAVVWVRARAEAVAARASRRRAAAAAAR